MSLEELTNAAWKARENAHAPYSGFAVGAALETDEGEVFTGCNVENISFGLTNCAERGAVFAAVASGSRRFRQIVIVADTEEAISPCGACRQVLAEFSPELRVTSRTAGGRTFEASLSDLLPRAKTGILEEKCST